MFRLFFLTMLLLGTGSDVFAHRAPPTPQQMAALDQQIASDPYNSRLLEMRGLNYAVLGNKDKSIADFKAAQKLSPRQVRLYWALGWALFNLEDYPAAVTVWEHGAALADHNNHPDGTLEEADPDDLTDATWIPCALALGYWAEGDHDKAIELFDMEAKVNVHYRDHALFQQETDNWTEKEQVMAMLLFDEWKLRADGRGAY
jgi:tetratricopeptide (TPR) repeat protein